MFYILAVPSLEERIIVKANVIGQSIAGDDTLAHNSTIPTPSETLKNVCSRPTIAPKMKFNHKNSKKMMDYRLCSYYHCLEFVLQPDHTWV